jgi:hypothetical protein
MAGASPSEIRQALRELKGVKARLFSGDSGEFAWKYSGGEAE